MRQKLPKKIQIMSENGKILVELMDALIQASKPGIATIEIDNLAKELSDKYKVSPLFIGYKPSSSSRPFPGYICIGTNDVLTHGIGSDQVLKDGDLVSIDFAFKKDGYCVDMARSFIAGGDREGTDVARKLIKATRASMEKGISAARSGATVGDIGSAIQTEVESNGYSVVRDMVGHAIGEEMHEDPMVPGWGVANTGAILEEYQTIAMDTLVNEGIPTLKYSNKDGWTVRSADGKLTCLFEDTFYVSKDGGVSLTSL